MPEVAISFNKRTYRFACSDSEAKRLEEITAYLKTKLDGLMHEHGGIGDERMILMAALMLADELFDARADIDELLEGRSDELRSVAANAGDLESDLEGGSKRLRANR